MTGNTVPIEPLRIDAPLPVSPQESDTRHLRSAEPLRKPRRRVSPVAGALTAVFVVLATFATQLGLSIAVSEGAYEMRALETEQRDLRRVERVLVQNVEKLASPQNLADNAAALGMVQNATPATLRLSDAAVLGDLAPRTAEVQENLVPNATLEHLPVVDAEGLLIERGGGLAAEAIEMGNTEPVAWEGTLPAPDTH